MYINALICFSFFIKYLFGISTTAPGLIIDIRSAKIWPCPSSFSYFDHQNDPEKAKIIIPTLQERD